MRIIPAEHGRYTINEYEIDVTAEMKERALQFAKDIILSDNQYSRLLPNQIRNSGDVDMKHKVEIQRTYMGKLGEMAFMQYLTEKGKRVEEGDMFRVLEGQNNTDSYDFETADGRKVDVKTGFRPIHKRLLVNMEQFSSIPKDFYVAVKLNAVDVDARSKLVDWDSVTAAVIKGYAEYTYMNAHAPEHDFGEGNSKYLEYTRLMGIDRLLNLF